MCGCSLLQQRKTKTGYVFWPITLPYQDYVGMEDDVNYSGGFPSRARWKQYVPLLLFSYDLRVLPQMLTWRFQHDLDRGCYFQEGAKVKMEMEVDTAYIKSLDTVLDWIHREVNTSKTQVFFRTYAPVHFRLVFVILSSSVCILGFSFPSSQSTRSGFRTPKHRPVWWTGLTVHHHLPVFMVSCFGGVGGLVLHVSGGCCLPMASGIHHRHWTVIVMADGYRTNGGS